VLPPHRRLGRTAGAPLAHRRRAAERIAGARPTQRWCAVGASLARERPTRYRDTIRTRTESAMSGREQWTEAAVAAFAQGGVEAVRVEAIARSMAVTKGSFYWHFADRPALLAAVLDRWETGARAVLDGASALSKPEQRMAALLRELARPTTGVADAEVFAWARRDRDVAERVGEVERARVVFLKEQLTALGVPLIDAHRRAEAGYLAAVAWLERAGRTPWMKSDYAAFVDDVFRLLLARSAQPVRS
jgi:AcrR family transcriptional regulator